MSLARFGLVFREELGHAARRPIFWFLLVLLAFSLWGLSAGTVRIASGDSQVGGTKAWITSEFAVTQIASFLVLLLYAFFVAVAAGMAVIHDEEHQVGPILHATPLTPAEYVYGKFTGVFGAACGVLVLHVLLSMFFNHVVPSEVSDEVRGPFNPLNYLKPALFLSLPTLFFLTATAFAVGTATRKPILVFVLPVITILVCGFFLWDWSPSWLSPAWNKVLMIVDPSGFRWLNETWLKVDKGVAFYNSQPVGYDATFWLNRAWQIAAALGALVLAERSFARSLKGATAKGGAKAKRRKGAEAETAAVAAAPAARGSQPISALRMEAGRPGLFAGIRAVGRAEVRELFSQPGLYLFIPLILLQVIGDNLFAIGAFDTPLLATPGTLAVGTFNTLTLLGTLLLLFYTVEGLERERATRLDPIWRATPVSTVAMLVGKCVAALLVAGVILAAVLLAGLIIVLVQGKVTFDVGPFLLVWGLLLVPTFLVWITFIVALHALVRNRYLTYALALAVLIVTGVRQMTGRMNWVGNWDMWATLQWSDMGLFELNRSAIVLNRVMVIGLAAFFIALTLRLASRRERDASRLGHRLSPGPLLRGALRLLPFTLVPLVAGTVLFVQVWNGFQGKAFTKKQKDYWRRNLATWKNAPLPDLAHVDLDMTLEPAKRSFAVNGSYRLINRLDTPLARFPLTGSPTWTNVRWTVNGDSAKPDDRLKLFVFTPKEPLAPGDSLTVGFAFDGSWPGGVTKNGAGTMTFALPSGVVLTSFEPSFAPMIGYQESIGIDKDNRYDAREYPDDHYKGVTKAAIGSSQTPFTTRIRLTGPDGFRYNSVGTLVSDETVNGRRTMTWASDSPVNFFNVVAARWAEKRGNGTVIYYHPEHDYNVAEMSEALDAARRYFSEWFYPFPWKELKLSEFPGLSAYAQGFPTNITFSEQIGFLTKSDPRANLAFMVTAHEAAHQWWGNILMPGEGPSGDILSEGMAHFSTILLFDQVKGPEQRIEFLKRIESRYGERRQVDSERPLVKIDGSKDGDQTVTYDKGGWVFWMLLNEMGRDPALAGNQAFIRKYAHNRDHALLPDYIEVMRGFAPDTTAFDAFADQWFRQVVVPEYKLANATKTRAGDAWEVTVELTNAGTGLMPVEVAAVAGERFPKKPAAAAPGGGGADDAHATEPAATGAGKPSPDYRETRTTARPAAGETVTVTLTCPFEPKSILIDPDARVLQLNRKHAVTGF